MKRAWPEARATLVFQEWAVCDLKITA